MRSYNMNSYKQLKPLDVGIASNCILHIESQAFIPFDPANTDYQKFKKDIAEGATLQDAEGNVMSAEDAQAFVATLP